MVVHTSPSWSRYGDVTVEAMKTVGVNSYKEISQKIDEGTKNRTVASTNMNATSRYTYPQSSQQQPPTATRLMKLILERKDASTVNTW